jgi:phage shock protein PspC (stress-responsive transcriptional regulator)
MKRIYRNKENGMLSGICAGLAEYFSIDVTIVRLVMVFATVATGFFPLIVTYVVGAVIIPEKSDLPPADSSSLHKS